MRGFRHFFSVPPLNTKRIVVRGIGVLEEVPARIVDRRRGTGDYLFVYFYDPVWLSSVELPSAQQAGGTLVIYTPGRWQYFGNRETPFRHSWMHCDGQIVRNLIKETGVPVDCALRVPDAGIVERAFSGIYEELTSGPRPDAMIVRNLLDNMLREVARAIRAPEAEVPPQIWKARRMIESQYGRKLSIADLAKEAGLSVSHFSELFHRHFGAPPQEYLLRHRLQHASHLLRDANRSVKDVAREVGYAEAESFSRLFRRRFGQAPTQYRKLEPEQEPG